MKLHAGTSGYSYKEWKGVFYPPKLPARQMLSFYATQLGAVEINQTFYRLPGREVLAGWASQVPGEFRFAVKVPRHITHMKRLRDVASEMTELLQLVEPLGAHLGALLVQLPPNLQRTDERLEQFVSLLPAGRLAAFEFRHASWDTPDVHRQLAARGLALVHSDIDGGGPPALHASSSAGYLRLRRDSYSVAELTAWAARIRAQPWQEAFVFFKHEQEGPARARALAAAFAQLER